MIKAIIFDYFGVLTSDKYWQYIQEHIVESERFQQIDDKTNTGRLNWQEFIDYVAKELHQTSQEVLMLYQNEKIDLDLLAYITKLHSIYRTALLTNASYEFLEPVIAKVRLDKIFDEIVISSRLGMIKPNPKLFEYTLNKLKVDRHQAVFVDDSITNVEVARQLGIKSILYHSFSQLQTELKSLL